MPPKFDQTKLDELMKLCSDIKADTGDIKNRLALVEDSAKDNSAKIKSIEGSLNDREQHSRNSSIRVFGLKVAQDVAKDAVATAKLVFDEVLSPILDAAVEKGLLHVIPKWFEVIEHCHTLPNAKVEGKPPIIVRFQSRLLRYLVFKFKRQVLTDSERNLNHISIVEDLTSVNFKKLMHLRNEKKVTAWSMSGKIYYEEDGVRKRL